MKVYSLNPDFLFCPALSVLLLLFLACLLYRGCTVLSTTLKQFYSLELTVTCSFSNSYLKLKSQPNLQQLTALVADLLNYFSGVTTGPAPPASRGWHFEDSAKIGVRKSEKIIGAEKAQ